MAKQGFFCHFAGLKSFLIKKITLNIDNELIFEAVLDKYECATIFKKATSLNFCAGEIRQRFRRHGCRLKPTGRYLRRPLTEFPGAKWDEPNNFLKSGTKIYLIND
jgi:hypothetical protein